MFLSATEACGEGQGLLTVNQPFRGRFKTWLMDKAVTNYKVDGCHQMDYCRQTTEE